MRAVRFSEYGNLDVLRVDDVPRPDPGPGQVLVQVKAAGINPGEAKIRGGALHSRFPAEFPSGQGSDLAGIVADTGPGVTSAVSGDEVLAWVDTRSSQAEYAVVEAANLAPRPAAVPWEVAGAIPVAGFTAWATVRAVGVKPGDTVVVSGAAGGVGSIAVQLARRAGATVIGLAGPANHEWLRGHGVVPVAYGDGVADRIRAAVPKTGGPRGAEPQADAFIDTFGGDYVELALNDLRVKPERVDTVARFDAAEKYGIKAEGNAAGASASVLKELGDLIAAGDLEIPVATYPLSDVRAAYAELDQGHTRGKIVLIP